MPNQIHPLEINIATPIETNDRPPVTPALDDESRKNVIVLGFAVIIGVLAAVVFAWTIWVTIWHFSFWEVILRDHFAAIVGLPGAAAASFAIVVFLRQTDGPIEFEGLGFKFKGASGQVAMWAICFLSITIAIKAVW
jgi:hypothetical protein